jgi:hypothetical protein
MLYYGQEHGMTEYRGQMRWHDGDADLTDYHRRLSAARREHDALRDGELDPVDYEVLDGHGSDGTGAGGDDGGGGNDRGERGERVPTGQFHLGGN